MNICICGGGNLGLVCAGFLAAQPSVQVGILTRRPESWDSEIEVIDPRGKVFRHSLSRISANPKEIIPQADIILLCLPGYAIETTLRTIKPHLRQRTIVGSIVSSTGFFFIAHEVLESGTPLFGFQRVPFIARLKAYGKSASLLGYKSELRIAVEGLENPETFRKQVENLFNTPTLLLNSFYEASLTNSNPILHTGRLYTMWHDWDGTAYERPIFFYKEWTDEASQLIIEMDKEFMRLTQALGISHDAIPPLLTYYESRDARSLTEKIRSIPAFEGILAPMKETEGGWIPDFESRYFTEDFPYGLKYVADLIFKKAIYAPNIMRVQEWGNSII